MMAVCADGFAGQAPVTETVLGDGFEAMDASALVRDAVDHSGAIRVAASEHWYSTQQLPDSLTVLGFDDPAPAGSALATLPNGVLMLDFSGALAGESLSHAAWWQAGTLHWVCGHAPPPLFATLLSGAADFTSLPDSVLPDVCRSQPSPATLIEAAWLATANARAAVSEYWTAVGPPATLAEAGLEDPLPVARAQLELEDGLLVATFVAPLAGETFAIAPWLQAGSIRWVCGHAPPPVDATLQAAATSAARTSLAESLLPHACRSNPSPASQVEDVVNGMAGARLAFVEYWVSNNTRPATLAATGLTDPWPTGQARVQLDDGVLVASFVGLLQDERLGIAPWQLGESIAWVCGHAAPPAGAAALSTGSASAQTTLAAALLPAQCR